MFIDAATVQQRLDNHSELESQVNEDPADAAAFAQLEMAYREQGLTEDLLQLLLTRAENVAEDRERVSLLRQAAELCSSSGDANSALLILLTAFDLDRGNPDLADELDQLAYVTGRWEEVLDAYLLAAAGSENQERAGDLWLRIACAHALVTGDSEALAAALEHVLSVNADWAQSYLDLVERQARRPDVVMTLADLCERIGDVPRRERNLTRCIAMTDSVVEKADLHGELAAMHLKGDDRMAANWHLREALRLDPSRQDCQAALIAMSKQDGDLRGAAEMLRSLALVGDEMRSDAAFEAAQLYSDLEENTQCFDLLAVTMAEDPHHLGAALPLAERYYEDSRWPELEPLLDLLIDNVDALPSSALRVAELYYRGGECAHALGDMDKARELFVHAVAQEPDNRKYLKASAEIALGVDDLETSYRSFERLRELEHDSAGLIRAQTVRRLAAIRFKQEQLDEAARLAQEAVELSPAYPEAAQLLAEICEAGGDYRAAVRARKTLLEHVELDLQVELHCEIAQVRCWKLDDPMGAIKEYELALGKRPDDRRLMHNLLELYSAAEMWRDAVDVILQIADLEEEPLRRGKYYDAAGHIIHVQSGDDRAVRCFNLALDCFFLDATDLPEHVRNGCMRPFHRMVEFLHEKEDYEQLERGYRKMIQRLSKDDPQVVHLWQELGQLYKGKLNRPEDAIASYEVVSTLDEGSNHKRILLDLYEQSDEQLHKAIAQRHELLAKNPLDPEHYGALTELYLRTNEPDRAWCATRALVFVGQASEAQKSFYYQNQPTEMRWPRVPVGNHMWAQLRHPGESPLVGNILSLIADVMLLDCAVDEAGLLARDGHTHLHNELRDLVRGVAYAMGMPAIRVTVDLELNTDLLFLPTNAGPAFVVGRGIWQAPSIRARVHAAARVLARARPDAQLRQLSASPEHMDTVLMAAMTYVRPDIQVSPQVAGQIAHIHQVLDAGLPQSRRVRLAHAVQALVLTGVRHDMQAWWRAVDCTAQRVAVLLSGDLQIAADIARRESDAAGEIIADLLPFSVSTGHGDMRRDLNIAI